MTWHSVTRKAPCQVCGKPDWCRVSGDGRLAVCRRPGPEAISVRLDRNGQPYLLVHLRSPEAVR